MFAYQFIDSLIQSCAYVFRCLCICSFIFPGMPSSLHSFVCLLVHLCLCLFYGFVCVFIGRVIYFCIALFDDICLYSLVHPPIFPSIRSCMYLVSLLCTHSFIHWFVCLCVIRLISHAYDISLVRSLVDLFVRWFVTFSFCEWMCWFLHLCIRPSGKSTPRWRSSTPRSSNNLPAAPRAQRSTTVRAVSRRPQCTPPTLGHRGHTGQRSMDTLNHEPG